MASNGIIFWLSISFLTVKNELINNPLHWHGFECEARAKTVFVSLIGQTVRLAAVGIKSFVVWVVAKQMTTL